LLKDVPGIAATDRLRTLAAELPNVGHCRQLTFRSDAICLLTLGREADATHALKRCVTEKLNVVPTVNRNGQPFTTSKVFCVFLLEFAQAS
jgi:hypothetical protein